MVLRVWSGSLRTAILEPRVKFLAAFRILWRCVRIHSTDEELLVDSRKYLQSIYTIVKHNAVLSTPCGTLVVLLLIVL